MPWCVEDFRTLVLAFCIVDVPVTALNNFLKQSFNNEYDSCCFRIVDDLDLDAFSKGHDSENPVPDDFVSPFSGWSLKHVKRWFITNVSDHPRKAFTNYTFVVIDKGVLPAEGEDEDNETAILCDAQTRMFKSVRVELPLLMAFAVNLDMKETMRNGSLGVFWRSSTTCTVEAYRLMSSGGMYFEKGIPERDERWRELKYKWREGGPLDINSCIDSDESEVVAGDEEDSTRQQ